MRFAILDGTPSPGGMGDWVGGVADGLTARGHEVHLLPLRDLRIGQCHGCFGCWTTTPGRCVYRDDGERLAREVIAADVAVLAAPVTMGFTGALLRRGLERLLPLLHPHMTLVNGEVHHRQRYARRPRFALLHGHEGVDAEDRELLALAYRRMAINYDSTLALVASSERHTEEVCDALARA